jgi:hypothetical protein
MYVRQNPISAINKAHTDLGYPEPATGGLVAAVRRGWALEARAAPSGQSDQRVGLPASVASRCLDLANRRTVSSVLLRAFVYVGFGFALMARSDTDINLQRQDVELTPSRIFVRLRREKGQATNAIRRRLEIPRAAVPGLYDALLLWQQVQQGAFDAARRTCPADNSFWRLPCDDAAAWTSSSAVCSAWVQLACTTLHEAPPDGDAWSSHSLRIGAASAANALDVNLLKIKDWGGWALASGAVMRYIRPVIGDAAAQRFFGWMRVPAGFADRPASR